MKAEDLAAISDWLVTKGLRGLDEMEIVNGFCLRCRQAGLNIDRALALIDTLHPVYEGRAFQWDNNQVPARDAFEYGPSNEGVSAENWSAPPSSTCA